jgi:hypothetical protein
MVAQASTSVIPGLGKAGNPEPTTGCDARIDHAHPVVGSGFSLREPRNDKGCRS